MAINFVAEVMLISANLVQICIKNASILTQKIPKLFEMGVQELKKLLVWSWQSNWFGLQRKFI